MRLKPHGLILTVIILLSGCSNNPEQTTFQEYPDYSGYSNSASSPSNSLKELYKKYVDEEGTNYENSFLRKKLQYVMKNDVFISLSRVLITKIDNSIETLNNDNCLPSDYTEDLFFPLSYSEVKSTELFPNKRSRANGNYKETMNNSIALHNIDITKEKDKQS